MLQIPKPQLSLPALHNFVATPVAILNGTTVAASGSINTKGAWVQMFAAATVTYDVYGISIFISNDAASATVTRNLYDIGIGAAASEIVKVPNILNTGTTNIQGNMWGQTYFLPIFIPKNTRISLRKQSNVASKTSSTVMILHGGGGIPPWATFTGCDSYATDTATSGGLAHTPGNTGTYSTYTNIGATLSKDYGAILPMMGMGSDTTMSGLNGYLRIGINSVTLGQYMFATSSAEVMGPLWPNTALYHKWISGTQMMLQATMSGTSDDFYEFGFLAFY